MPVISDNSFAQGQAAAANVNQAFMGSYATAAQFAVALKRMQAMEKQFQAQLDLQKQNFRLREEQFAAQQAVNVLKIEQMQMQLEAGEQEKKEIAELDKILPDLGKAASDYFKAASEGKQDAAFKALETGFQAAAVNPRAFSTMSNLLRGQGQLAEAFSRAMQPKTEDLPTDVEPVNKTVELVTEMANSAAGAGERERKQLTSKRQDLLRQASDRLRLAEAVSTVEFMGTIDPASLTGNSAAWKQAVQKLSKEMADARARGNLQQVKLMEEARTLMVQQVGLLDREQDKLAVKQRMTEDVVRARLVDSGVLTGQSKQFIAQVGITEASTRGGTTAAAIMAQAGKVVDELYQQMDADPDLQRTLNSIKYGDLDENAEAWESISGSLSHRFPGNVDPAIIRLVIRSYLEQVGGAPPAESRTKTTEAARTEREFQNLDF